MYSSLSKFVRIGIILVMVSIVYANILATTMSVAITNIHIYVITNLLCKLYVKLNMKIYTFITFQKHYVRIFFVDSGYQKLV